ncbi:hypothetical protein HWD94_12960 [Pseudarthrobacter equi]|uniref:hypothetical protein n=1 Tax=Pseudarthrobacter TaxID=1742993 RepID=UPI00158576E0|nr:MULTISPECIES: hypothetical protein [Pseudarthrobacter]MCT9626025.1 hypothetical protein [Pseudarthrobacter equi]NUT72122.1 hypothetical protein [Pseudarthrobacter sp. C4D7]
MNDPEAQHPGGRSGRPRTGPDYSRIQRILVLIFTAAAAGCWVLVAADLAVGRPAGGDVFIAALNTLAAAAFWWMAASNGAR